MTGKRTTKGRTKTPSHIETEVLVKSRRRCCLCYFLNGDDNQKEGQIAHLDKNPSNASEKNLAFLCLDHHDKFDSSHSQSKGITIDEVKRSRDLLYRALGAIDSSASVKVTLKIDRDFMSFGDEDGRKILDMIKTSLNLSRNSEIRIVESSRGCVRLTVALGIEDGERLVQIVKSGELVEAGVVAASIEYQVAPLEAAPIDEIEKLTEAEELAAAIERAELHGTARKKRHQDRTYRNYHPTSEGAEIPQALEFRNQIARTYRNLRLGVGGIAILLPIALYASSIFFPETLQTGQLVEPKQSISSYYHSSSPFVRDFFVGSLCATGVFLVLYRGFNSLEDLLLNLAGFCVIGVALVPMDAKLPTLTDLPDGFEFSRHGAFAVCFFLAIALVVLTQANGSLSETTESANISRYKRTYKTLGILMVVLPFGAWALLAYQLKNWWIFAFETLAIWVFAAYWIVKTVEFWGSNGRPEAILLGCIRGTNDPDS